MVSACAPSNEQASTFMHELGHILGLRHGGHEDTNYKPNYLSVNQRQWMLSREGALQALATLEPGRPGAAPSQAPALHEQQRWRFEHAGRSWQLAIFVQVQPQPQPGIATEEQHSLDLLLWQWRGSPTR